jgi:tRNA1Val (adenine37-N6)-methyltransferase
MSEAPFRFKQFSVAHDRCAMKVNTDGVLLGAWADLSGTRHILDIGTGTGLIALMLAQRNTQAIIHAIDIDESAYLQAADNFSNSPWAARLHAFHCALQQFSTAKKYDTIVSNPPYFIDDFKTGHVQRDVARHSTALSYEQLLHGINKLLTAEGRAFLVIPHFNLASIQSMAAKENLHITRATSISAISGKKPYLALLCLEREPATMREAEISIQGPGGIFTAEYIELTKDFYLKF